MSILAIEWAFQQSCPTPTQKLVLLALADHHNAKTDACFPSAARLVDRTGLSRATVFRTIKLLERKGILAISRIDGRPNSYTLCMDADQSHHETPPVAPCDPTSLTVRPDPSQGETLTGSNRKEPSSNRVQPHALPHDWEPDAGLIQWARQSFPNLDIEYERANFTDYWIGCGKPKADWRATWRNWMRRAAKQSAAPVRSIGRATRTMEQNRERIDAAMARRSQGNEPPAVVRSGLRLIEGGSR